MNHLKHLKRLAVTLIFCSASLLPCTPLFAGQQFYYQYRQYTAQSQIITAKQAARIAKRSYGGKVLSAKLKKPKGAEPYYVVKIIKKGNIRIIRISATGGK